MTKLTFKKTHRLIQRASDSNFNYATVEIDITNGLFHKCQVDADDTLIRVKSGVFGEAFTKGKRIALSVDQINALQTEFNAVRAERNWYPVEFRTTKEVAKVDMGTLPEDIRNLTSELINEVSNTSQVQGQEETQTI